MFQPVSLDRVLLHRGTDSVLLPDFLYTLKHDNRVLTADISCIDLLYRLFSYNSQIS